MPSDVQIFTARGAGQDTGESGSPVSWAAIFAGAAASLALSFALVGLAAGFGVKLAAPWPGARPSSSDFTPILGSGIIVVQVLSSALGGYLAGRLRTKWLNLHSHEVHFRDTAHGLLVWAVSTIAGVLLLATILAPPAERAAGPTIDRAAAASPATAVLSPDDAAAVRASAERDANLAAQVSFFVAFGLLLSAFTASVAAALGGLRRDEMFARYWTEQDGLAERIRVEP